MFIVVCFSLLFLLSGDEAAIDAWARSKKLQGSREHLTRELQQKINRAKKGNGVVRNISRDGLPSPIITQRGAAGRFSALPAKDNLSLTAENASGGTGKTSEKINGGTAGYGDDNSRLSVAPDDAFVQAWAKVLVKRKIRISMPIWF